MSESEFSPFSTELLKELHILTVDGKLNQDSRRKMKQILHLNQFITPLIHELKDEKFSLVDVGAGKSYLGFLLYDQIIKNLENGNIVGIENRAELIKKSIELAKRLKFTRMNFISKSIQEVLADLDSIQADIVTALHACDTATDDAVKLGILKNAKFIVVIPCCQAEVATLLKVVKPQMAKESITQLFRHPIHTREFGSHLTNIMRSLLLESKGYQVSVTEFVGPEHSLKNELIIAKNIHQENLKSKKDLENLIETFKLNTLNHRFLF